MLTGLETNKVIEPTISEVTQLTSSKSDFNKSSESSNSSVSEKRCKVSTIAKTITGIGIGATALFFGAPITIPLSVATLVAGGVIHHINNTEPPDNADATAASRCLSSVVFGILGGGAAGGVAGYYAWQPTIDFVYSPHIVFISATTGGAIIGLGVALWVGSYCCEKKHKPQNKVLSV